MDVSLTNQKICPVCNRGFLGYKKTQISCSNVCSKKNYARLHPRPKKDRYRLNNLKREKVCKLCQKQFRDTSYGNNMQFCSSQHNQRFYVDTIVMPNYYLKRKIKCIICNVYFNQKNGFRTDIPICSNECMTKHLSSFNELGYILGVIASDGFITSNNTKMGLTVKDKDYAETFLSYLKKIFPFLNFKLYPHSDGRFRVYCTRRDINEPLSNFFENKNKTLTWIVPKIILNNELMTRNFLSGFFDGEATVNIRKKYLVVQCYSANEAGLNQISELLKGLNINHTISCMKRKGKKFYSKKDKKMYEEKSDIYVISISRFEDIKRFDMYVGFKIKRKDDKIKKFLEDFKYKALPWGSDQLEILKDKSLTARELSKKLNANINRIKNKRRSLGISFWKRMDWTSEQIKILNNNYGKINNKELSSLIGKPIHCLVSKIYRLRNGDKIYENNR